MVYRIALSISLLAFPLGLGAQTADDYFHGGAQSYIQAEKEKARQEVFTGLQKFPTDPKLNGMAGLLKKQEEEKQKQQQQQEQQEKEQQQAKQSSGKPDDKSDEKDREKTYAVGQMTPEQAQQLLDTQKNEEKLLPIKPTGKPVDRSRPLRDW